MMSDQTKIVPENIIIYRITKLYLYTLTSESKYYWNILPYDMPLNLYYDVKHDNK